MATKPKKQNRSRKNRKFGRCEVKCARYKTQGRRERNKARRTARHVRHHPNDLTAAARLEKM